MAVYCFLPLSGFIAQASFKTVRRALTIPPRILCRRRYRRVLPRQKFCKKNRLYKRYRRLHSLTAHHSTVNQFQPYSLLRLVALNPATTLVINYPPRHKQYTIIQEDCQCPFGHSYNFAAFCTNSKNSALNWSSATQLSFCKREMTLPKLACPLYSD